MPAITRNTTAIAAKVIGSVARTPTSIAVIIRVRASAAIRPTMMPALLRRIPCTTTSRRMAAGAAPRRKHPDQDQRETGARLRARHQRAHRLDVCDQELRIQTRQFGADRSRVLSRIAAGADGPL